jgi:hypothetical protein
VPSPSVSTKALRPSPDNSATAETVEGAAFRPWGRCSWGGGRSRWERAGDDSPFHFNLRKEQHVGDR